MPDYRHSFYFYSLISVLIKCCCFFPCIVTSFHINHNFQLLATIFLNRKLQSFNVTIDYYFNIIIVKICFNEHDKIIYSLRVYCFQYINRKRYILDSQIIEKSASSCLPIYYLPYITRLKKKIHNIT